MTRAISLLFVFLTNAVVAVSSSGEALSFGNIRFDILSTMKVSNNTLKIVPHGLSEPNQAVSVDVDGVVVSRQVADLNKDGWPELYIITQSDGSGSYGDVIGFSVNKGKSMSDIYLPPLKQAGYMGHDRFEVHGDHISRTFPLYKKTDPNAAPSGGKKTIRYELVAGEAGWRLEPQAD